MSYDESLRAGIESLKAEGRYRDLSVASGVSFIDNDYLGLSQHPEILSAGRRALEIFGAGSRGSRLLGGHSRLVGEVEASLAEFFRAPAALFFSSGYLANLAVVTAMGKQVESVVCDQKIHASLIDAVALTKLPKHVLPHNLWEAVPERSGRRLFLAESLYSMDGDFARLGELRAAAELHDAFVVLDEAHAAGVFPGDGAGLGWKDWSRMAVVVTFGKAFGVAGAAVLGSPALKEWLVNVARSFIYTTAPPPVVVAMVGEALGVMRREAWRREELWDRARLVRRRLRELTGMPFFSSGNEWDEASPIIPVLIPGEDKALRFCENMREKGVYLRAIRYPTVARGSERVRLSLSLTVSRENTIAMAEELGRAWTAFSS